MERNNDNATNDIAESASRYFLDYSCTRCGFAWCDADEVADAADCPNCGAWHLSPQSVVTLGRQS